MLETAFYESRSLRELSTISDYRFVVGRRGSGKSALCAKLEETFRHDHSILLVRHRPIEEKLVAFHEELAELTADYSASRMVTRLGWKIQILSEALSQCLIHWKASKLADHAELLNYANRHAALFEVSGSERCLRAFRLARAANRSLPIGMLPEAIADLFAVRRLEELVASSLAQLNRRVVFLYDGLDEGWVPNPVSTGILGGLAKAAAEFRESAQHVHCLLFIRDNMLRALAQLDGDYSRNIEGNALRLQWDEQSLLGLVTMRLRVAFGWQGDNDVKVWNRFAQRDLEGIDGFRRCLRLTLYRPRDVITLLNGAYRVAEAAGRDRLIETDVDSTATAISINRFRDLTKEYETVLPGLPDLAEAFREHAARTSYQQALGLLDGAIEQPHNGLATRDFALLENSSEAFSALYSVGFLGLQDEGTDRVRFCHDGSNTDVHDIAPSRSVVLHPCYWRALGAVGDESESVLIRVDDEGDVVAAHSSKMGVQEVRLRRLGQAVEELPRLPVGLEGAHEFERWVFSTVRYLFSRDLDNIELKPNPNGLQQRDIVGSLRGTGGFWRRIEQQYDVAQFTLEAKNFAEMAHDEFRQAWGYLRPPYGRCLMIVTRAEGEAITERERALVKDGYDGDPRKLVLLMPAKLLQRALSKMRSGKEKRDDWVQQLLVKRLDTFERSYTTLRTPRSSGGR